MTGTLRFVCIVAVIHISQSMQHLNIFAQDANKLQVKIVTPSDLQKVIAAQKGKIVVIDHWATWCIPCIKGLPKTLELGKQHPQDITLITLSFDPLEEGAIPAKTVKMLERFKATSGLHFISKYELTADEAAGFQIGGGTLPNYQIYDRQGKLAKKFESGEDDPPFTHADMETFVTKLLKK